MENVNVLFFNLAFYKQASLFTNWQKFTNRLWHIHLYFTCTWKRKKYFLKIINLYFFCGTFLITTIYRFFILLLLFSEISFIDNSFQFQDNSVSVWQIGQLSYTTSTQVYIRTVSSYSHFTVRFFCKICFIFYVFLRLFTFSWIFQKHIGQYGHANHKNLRNGVIFCTYHTTAW